MTNTDGGPAFPVLHTIDGNWVKDPVPQYSGMSLRDWFAGQALAGLLSHMGGPYIEAMAQGIKGGALESCAAYAWADAMLAEREKKA